MLWLDRLRAALATLRYGAAWTLPPRLARTLRASLRQLRPVFSPAGIVLHPYAPPIGTRAFGRYLNGLKRMARGERVPLVVHISVTDRCRNACPRCSNLPRSQGDPPLENLVALIDRLRRMGTVTIALTGGEPMLRPDLAEIVAACAPDISATLFTTGHALDAVAAGRLRAAGLDMAFISLDHADAGPHDRQRGVAGVHDQAVAAIRACRDAGLYTAAQAVVDDALARDGELDRLLTFCGGLGVHEVMLLEPVAVHRDAPRTDVTDALRARLVERHKQSVVDARNPKVSSMSFLESPEFLGCQAGFGFVYINAAGDMFPCDFAPISLGNVYNDPPGEIWNRAGRFFPRPTCGCLTRELNFDCSGSEPPSVSDSGIQELLRRRQTCATTPAMTRWLDRDHTAKDSNAKRCGSGH